MKSFRTRGFVAVAVVAAMVGLNSQSAIAAPAGDPTARPDVAQSITKHVTGSTARELVVAEAKDGGLTARQSTSATGTKLRTLVQDREGGFAVLAVLEDGQSSATFTGLVPEGATVKANGDGGLEVIASNGTQTSTIKAPWAKDANGRSLTTSYTVEGSKVIQTVDTEGATFPIVADPWVTFGWGVYLHLNRVDQGVVAGGGAAGMSILVCAIPGVNIVGCAAVTAALVGAAIYIAAYGFCRNALQVRIPNMTYKCV